jgi:hypothetical protein
MAKFLFVYRSDKDTFDAMARKSYSGSTRSGENGLPRGCRRAGGSMPAPR